MMTVYLHCKYQHVRLVPRRRSPRRTAAPVAWPTAVFRLLCLCAPQRWRLPPPRRRRRRRRRALCTLPGDPDRRAAPTPPRALRSTAISSGACS